MVAPQYTLCVIDVFVCIYQHSSVGVCKSICCCCCPSDPAGVRTRVWARCLLGLALTNPMILNRIEEEKESLSAASGLFTTEDNLHVFNALPHPCSIQTEGDLFNDFKSTVSEYCLWFWACWAIQFSKCRLVLRRRLEWEEGGVLQVIKRFSGD